MGPVTGGAVMRRELLRVAVATLLAVGLAGAVSVERASHVARADVEAEVARASTALARDVVAPLVDDGVRRGDPVALAQLDRVARSRFDSHGVVRIKVWDADGTVLYSDHDDLVGRNFMLDTRERAALLAQTAVVDFGDVDEAENAHEEGLGPLFETYVGSTDATGRRILVETYSSVDLLEQVERSLRHQGLLTAGAAAGVVLLVLLPSVVGVTRRLSGSLERQRVARENAVRSSETERSRLAAYLHDEVIQDLAGAGYLLGATRRTVATAPVSLTSSRLDQVQSHVEHTVRHLRLLLSDLYPAPVERDLVTGVRELCDRTAEQGVRLALLAPRRLEASDIPAVAVYRVAREALRNVVVHADASTVTVSLTRDETGIGLEVVDDGRGFDVGDTRSDGHLGLRLMHDVASDADGRLEMDTRPGSGTAIRLWVPDPGPRTLDPRDHRPRRRAASRRSRADVRGQLPGRSG